MPGGKSSSDTEYALNPVPLAARLPLIAAVLLWASLTLDPSAPYLAMWWGSSHPFLVFLAAVLIADIVLSIFSSISGYIASREGLTYALACERVFGKLGVLAPSVWAGVVCVGWLAFSIGVVADTLLSLAGVHGAAYYVVAALMTLLFTVTAYKGVRHIVKLASIGVPMLIILLVAGAVMAFRTPHSSLNLDAPAGAFSALPILMMMILGTFVNGSITLSFDYQRFCRSPGKAVLAGFVNFLGFWSFILVISAIPAVIVGKDLISTYKILGLTPLAAITLFILAWTSADNQLYSASLNWTLASKAAGRLSDRRRVALVAAAATIALAAVKLHTFAVQWLEILTSISLPAGIVVWSDYLLKRKILGRDWSVSEKVNKPAFIAWAVGAIVIYYLSYKAGVWYALPAGFAVTFIIYILLEYFFTK